jgi:hypothetical protein
MAAVHPKPEGYKESNKWLNIQDPKQKYAVNSGKIFMATPNMIKYLASVNILPDSMAEI